LAFPFFWCLRAMRLLSPSRSNLISLSSWGYPLAGVSCARITGRTADLGGWDAVQAEPPRATDDSAAMGGADDGERALRRLIVDGMSDESAIGSVIKGIVPNLAGCLMSEFGLP